MPAPPNYVGHKPHFHRNEAWKQPVRLASTTDATFATAFANGQTLDGETLATGDRILIKDQTDAEFNGIYVVAASGEPARAYDMDVGTEFAGAVVLVLDGTQAGTLWRCENTATVDLDVDDVTWANVTASPGASGAGQITAVVDGGGSAITGTPYVDLVMPFAGTFDAWTILANTSGSAAFDVLKGTYAGFPPTSSIVASAPPTLTTATKATDSTLTGWTTGFAVGDIIRVSLTTSSTVGKLTLALDYTRT